MFRSPTLNTPVFRTLTAALLVAAGLTAGAALVGPSSAQAAEIPDAISALTVISHQPADNGDLVELQGTWSVPDGSASGDTFTLQLPSQLDWAGKPLFDLTDTAGDVVAQAGATSTGLITFTLTDYVTAHPNDVHGTFDFSAMLTGASTTGGTQELPFPTGTDVITVPLDELGSCTGSCEAPAPTSPYKTTWFPSADQSYLDSAVESQATTDATNTIVITDTPQAGSAVDCSTVGTNIGTWDPTRANVAQPDESGTYPVTIECSTASATATWTGVPAGLFARLSLSSTITDPALSTYANDGSVGINDNVTAVSASVARSVATGTGIGDPLVVVVPPVTTPPVTTPPVTTPVVTTPPVATPPATTPAVTTPAAVTPTATTVSPLASGTADTAATNASTLAYTGSTPQPFLAAAAALAAAGVLLLVASRRRRLAPLDDPAGDRD